MAGAPADGGFNIHPMDQFMVKPLFGGEAVYWYTPTNATLWMALTVVAVSLLMVAGARGRALIPSRAQSMAELTYGFVRKMVEDVAGKEGAKYFPYILTLFLFILFANLLAPVAWLIGVPWTDAPIVGDLLGKRMVLNELIAFSELGPLKDQLAERSFTIATFALCGFANFSSIGIQIGGIGALAPNKRSELAKLGIRAMLAGTMANLMSASIAGMLL